MFTPDYPMPTPMPDKKETFNKHTGNELMGDFEKFQLGKPVCLRSPGLGLHSLW